MDLVLNGHVQNYERSKPLARPDQPPARNRLRRDRRRRRAPQRLRHPPQAALVGTPRRLLPPAARHRRQPASCAARRSTPPAAPATASPCAAASRLVRARRDLALEALARLVEPPLHLLGAALLARRPAPGRGLRARAPRRTLLARSRTQVASSRGRSRGRRGRGAAASSAERGSRARACCSTSVVRTTCLSMPSSFGSKPSARPTSCGRCRTGRPRSRPTTFAASGCWRSRFRWQSGHGVTSASASGVDRVADVAAGLLQRGLAVHRDDREAAALARALVVDRLAAERLDHLLEVVVALGMLVVAEPDGRAAGRSSRRTGPTRRPVSGRTTMLAQPVEPVVLDQQPEEVLVVDAASRSGAPRPRAPR